MSLIVKKKLPKGWTTGTLGDVANYINGKAFKPSDWAAQGKPIIRIQNLTGSTNIINRYNGSVEDKFLVKDGDLLISWSATVNAFIYRGDEAVLNQHIFKVEPRINKMFLFYYVKAFIAHLSGIGHGSGMQHITKGKFESYPVLLPPLPEQERIAKRIEDLYTKLNDSVHYLKIIKLQLTQYRQSILHTALTGSLSNKEPHDDSADKTLNVIKKERKEQWHDSLLKEDKNLETKYTEVRDFFKDILPKIPERWKLDSLERICYRLAGGSTPLRTNEKNFDPRGYPLLKVENIQKNGEVVLTEKQLRISKEIHEKQSRSIVFPNDVLVNIVGPPLGKIGLIPAEIKEANINQAVVLLRIVPSYNPRLLWYILRSPFYTNLMTTMSKGDRQSNIRKSDVGRIPIPIIPVKEQERLLVEIEKHYRYANLVGDLIKQAEENIEKLYQSILVRACSGELVHQDPRDEPAIKLLERIRKEKEMHIELKQSIKIKKSKKS